MKKLLLLLMALPGLAIAQDSVTYIVETPEMVDMYFLIFNAIGRIFSTGEYVDLLRLTFLMGSFMVFAGGVLKASGGNGSDSVLSGYLKYLFIGVALLTMIFWKSDLILHIKSKTVASSCDPTASQSNERMLDNSGMPTVLAYAFYMTNQIGTTLTELAEDTYSTIGASTSAAAYQGMSQNGGYMGALKGTMHLLSIDPRKISLRNDLNASDGSVVKPFDYGRVYKSLFTDCILIPFSSKGDIGARKIEELKASNDIQDYLKTLYAGGVMIGDSDARDYYITYSGEVSTCGEFYDDVIKPYSADYKNVLSCSEPIGFGAVSLITGAGSANIQSSFDEVSIQSGLIVQVEESVSDLGIGVSGVGYATGKTRAEFIQSSMASGTYMAEMLPYLQMTIRAILYAFFPFVFVVVLLPGGIPVLGNYFQSLLWIELWTPTAAILDLFMSSQAHSNFDEIYSKEGLTMMSSIDLLSAGSTIAGVAGYLYLSVPALTWLILKGSAHMMQGITSATAAGMATNIKTDTLNKDQEKIAMTNEMSSRSGEDLSISEAQHYNAIQQGTFTGAASGVNRKAGLDTATDAKVFKQSSELENYKQTSEATGRTGANLGAAVGAASSIKTITEATTGSEITSASGGINDTAMTSARVDSNEALGTMGAKEETASVQTEGFHKDLGVAKTAELVSKVDTMKKFTGSDELNLDNMNKVADVTSNAAVADLTSKETAYGTEDEARRVGDLAGENLVSQAESTNAQYKEFEHLGKSASTIGKLDADLKNQRFENFKGKIAAANNAGISVYDAANNEGKASTVVTADKDGNTVKSQYTMNGELGTQDTQTKGTKIWHDGVKMATVDAMVDASMVPMENAKIDELVNEGASRTAESMKTWAANNPEASVEEIQTHKSELDTENAEKANTEFETWKNSDEYQGKREENDTTLQKIGSYAKESSDIAKYFNVKNAAKLAVGGAAIGTAVGITKMINASNEVNKDDVSDGEVKPPDANITTAPVGETPSTEGSEGTKSNIPSAKDIGESI